MQCWRSPREPEDWMNTWDFPNEPQARSLCKCAKSANGMIICRISMQSSVQWAKLKFIIYHIWRCWHIIHNKDNISFKWGKTKQAFIRRDNSPGKRKTSDIGATFWTKHEMNSQWTAARKKNFAKILIPWYISVYTYMECIVGRVPLENLLPARVIWINM